MLQELPTGQYLCLVEYFYNGLKETEVAQKLGMPLGTVKTNLSRAKKKLKDIIQTHEKKSGVKLYSMSWLLLLLWKDLFISAATPAQTEATLSTIMSQLPEAAETVGTAGTVGAAGSAGASGTAAAAEVGGTAAATAKVGVPLAAKIVAGVLAAATALGGVTAALSGRNEPASGPSPVLGEMGVPTSMHYNGHYYNLVGPFADWDQVLDYREDYGGYPITVNSAEENWIISVYAASRIVEYEENGVTYGTLVDCPTFTGLYWDMEDGEWKWVNGEAVTYTNWFTTPDSPSGAGHFGAYCPSQEDIQWRVGTLGEDETEEYWIVWEYEEDSTYEQRLGSAIERIDPREEPERILEFRVEDYYYEENQQGGWPDESVTSDEQEPPETIPPQDAAIMLTDEEKARMEQILLYIAYADSGTIDTYVGQGWEEWLEHREYEKFRFLELTEPAPDMWDKCEVLLLMGWNQDPALECGFQPAFDGDSWSGAVTYRESRAREIITELLGDFDTTWLHGNVIAQGYYVDVYDGIVHQPATHLFSENYGTLQVDRIEDLGDGKVAIYAVYERGFVLDCVYIAQKNPASIIGYTLTAVSYDFAE